MGKQELLEWVKRQYGTEPDYPWADDNAVLRHRENRKWYGLVMDVQRGKLGMPGAGSVCVLNVKCEPVLIGSLRERPGFHPAYHMNKDKWITVRLDGSVAAEEIRNLVDLSYRLTMPKPKKNQGRR